MTANGGGMAIGINSCAPRPRRRSYRKACAYYTLRHSFVTAAITDGMSTLDVARFVGTSVVMIEKHYGHLVASAARERLAEVKIL